MDIDCILYKELLLKTKRGNSRGIFSNAKPIFLVSIIDAINRGYIIGNKIKFENEGLENIYKMNFATGCNDDAIFRANAKITPFRMPFYHLNAEPYYHIKWRNELKIQPKQANSPSIKFLKEFVDFAYLDDKLWELFQHSEIRKDFRDAIVKQFLIEE